MKKNKRNIYIFYQQRLCNIHNTNKHSEHIIQVAKIYKKYFYIINI